MILNKLQRVWLSVVRLPPTAAFIEIEVVQGCRLFSFSCSVFLFMRMVSLEHFLPLLTYTWPVNTVSLNITKNTAATTTTKTQQHTSHGHMLPSSSFFFSFFLFFLLLLLFFFFFFFLGGGGGGAFPTIQFQKRNTSISVLFSSRYNIVCIWETDCREMERGVTG